MRLRPRPAEPVGICTVKEAVMGISLEGYCAPRNASIEKRFKACGGL